MNHNDVLIVAALPDEHDAAKVAAMQIAGRGVQMWNTGGKGGTDPYLWGEYRTADGGSFSIALARPTRAGGRSTSGTVSVLVERLRPSLLAMCGVCAGNPAQAGLGEVIVADMAYEWDEGKHSGRGFEADQRHIPMDHLWLREAQDFDPSTLPSFGSATDDEAMLWLLERLNQGQDPRSDPARAAYFPPGTWAARLARFEAAGVIVRDSNGLVGLTEAGARLVRRRLYDDVDGPAKLPFAVRVGPMASGSAVMGDSEIWQQLADRGVRKIVAADMEAATIATIAHRRNIPWLVVKGVTDHVGIGTNDRYATFGARSSAEVLYTLIERTLRVTRGSVDRGGADPDVLPPPPQHGSENFDHRTSVVSYSAFDESGVTSDARPPGKTALGQRHRIRLLPSALAATITLSVAIALPAILDQFRDQRHLDPHVYHEFELEMEGGFAYDIDLGPDESSPKNYGYKEQDAADAERDLYRSGRSDTPVDWQIYVPQAPKRGIKPEMLSTLPRTSNSTQCRSLSTFSTATIEGNRAAEGDKACVQTGTGRRALLTLKRLPTKPDDPVIISVTLLR